MQLLRLQKLNVMRVEDEWIIEESLRLYLKFLMDRKVCQRIVNQQLLNHLS